MPAMGTTGQPPNFNGNFSTPMRGSEEGIPINVHDGRGWEPKRTFVGSNERTYASVRSISGRNRRERTGEYDRREMPREFSASAAEWAASRPTGPPWQARPHSTQPGLYNPSLRAHYFHYDPDLPAPTSLGEGDANLGFDVRRAVASSGRAAGWERSDIPYSTKRVPADSPRQHADSTWPFLMNGKVVANGDRVREITPPHHSGTGRMPYHSPDRALVGEEEKTALSTALKRRQEADKKPVKTYVVPEVNRPPFSRDKRNAGADVAGRPKVRL